MLGSNENTFRITGNSGFIYGGGGSGPARADESQVWDDEGDDFCTRDFYFEFAIPSIFVHRTNDMAADCSNLNSALYRLQLNMEASSGYWEDYKECNAYTDMGYKMCQGLANQGFTLDDERGG